MIPHFLASPDHQKHWYWLCKVHFFVTVNTWNADRATIFDCSRAVLETTDIFTRQKISHPRRNSNPRSLSYIPNASLAPDPWNVRPQTRFFEELTQCLNHKATEMRHFSPIGLGYWLWRCRHFLFLNCNTRNANRARAPALIFNWWRLIHGTIEVMRLKIAHFWWASKPGFIRCITMTSWWAQWHLKSPASRLFTQPFI